MKDAQFPSPAETGTFEEQGEPRKRVLPEEEDVTPLFEIDWVPPIPFHEATSLLPFMDKKEYAALVENIRINGLQVPIVLYEGKIIDGRHRYMACIQAKREPRFVKWEGKGSVSNFVVSANYHRRHLTPSQKAAIALDFLPALEAEALERKKAGQPCHEGLTEHDKHCQNSLEELDREIVLDKFMEGVKFVAPDIYKDDVEKFPHGSGRVRDILSKIFGVSGRYISEARAIQRKNPELLKMMKDRKITVQDAKRLLSLPEQKQLPIILGIQSGGITNAGKAIKDVKIHWDDNTALKAAFRDLKRLGRKYSYYRGHKAFEILDAVFTEIDELTYPRLKRFMNRK
ncbi:MAG: ParB N-terminal domain-containing protein [Thermodesulfobacteriota bacterium]|jgi:hypothetical protein